MGKTLGYGEITVANMTEPFTVMLTNEAQQFATDSNRKVTSAQSYYTDIIVIRGSQERTDYTIGNITSGSGITVSKSSKRVTFNVSAGTTIGADTGVIEIPITLDGQTVKKQFSWSCGKQGPQGVKGTDGNSFAWNMLSETNCGKKHWGTVSSGGKYSVESETTEDNIEAVKLICTESVSSSGWSYTCFTDLEMLKQLKPSTKYTLSYDIKANRSGMISHTICRGDITNSCTNTVVVSNIIENETWQHISVVLTTNDLKTTPTNEVVYLGRTALSKVGYAIIKNLKLAEGDVDTPWSPSQSDIEGKGIAQIVQYYLATSQASGVTSSTSGWSTDITAQKITATKKYLWNCSQTKYTDGTSEPITTPTIIGVYGDTGVSTKILTTSYSYNQSDIDKYSKSGYSGTWGVGISTNGLKVGDNVLLKVKNTTKNSDCLIFAQITKLVSEYQVMCTSYGAIDNGADGQDGAGFHWNLLSGTKDLDKSKITFYSKATIEPTKYLDFTVVKATALASSYSDILKWHDVLTPTPNTTYTLSFYAKASVETYCRSHFYPSCTVKNVSNYEATTASDGGVRTKLSTEWNRYSVTWTTSSSVSGAKSIVPIRLEHGNTADGATVYLCGIKLEQSDKPSPWCTTYEETLAKNLSITPSSQYFKSTDGGKTFAPNTITIKPTIQGEINFGKWQYSIDGGVSFADVVSGQKGLTISNNVLTVSKDSSLYSDAVTMITFRAVADDSSFYDTCSIAKIYDVSDIGDGRNLLWNSNFAKTDEAITGATNSWGLHTRGTNLVASIDTSTKHNGFNTLKTVSAANGDKNSSNDLEWFAWGISERTSDNLHSKNQNYTLSFYAKASVTTDFIVRWGYDAYGADTTRTLTTNWQKYEIKLHQATSAYSITIIFKLLTAGTVWFSEFKLEKGSSATGYSTAPEDLQTAILSTKSEISDVSLEVDNNKQAIEQRVEKTTYQQDLKLVKGDISKANEGLNKWRYEIYPKSLFASEYQGKSTMDVFAKNTNLTPSQSVLINDMDLSIAWNYDNNYIGYALTFAKFSAAKSVAITFAHDDGAHIYLNGKLIGGSDAYSQTGESLTLDFVKGWNCIEVVVNEGASTEGFKLGTTISAISECQLMNCYYGTPVARQSHITNQLVENTTNIEGVTTTMQKVMTTVGGSDRIDEFVNNYNKTIESEKQFKKTIGETYTTKDDFNGLEIGGRNLLLYSQTIRAHKDYYGVGWLTDEVETFNGCPVWSVKNQWGRLTWLFKSHVIDRGLVKVGDTLTYSLYAKTNNASGKSINCSYRFKGNTNAYWFNGSAFNVGTNWTRYSVTFTITKDMLATDTYMTEIGFEETASMSGDDKVYYACPKLERGTKATDYTPALEDNEINGQNLVSNLSSNWEQGSVSYVANSTYASIKTVLATRLRTEDVFSVSGNVTISAGTSTNSSKEELNFYYVLFDVNKKAIGVPASGSEWQSLTSPKIINCGDAKYMAIILRWGSGSTVITPSNISQICLKIERGTSATPFTLAPEDVNGKIVNVETIANQTAKEFSWIVKGGDSSSNFELTDRTATLVANKINLNGLVTFSGLNTDTQNKINSAVNWVNTNGTNTNNMYTMVSKWANGAVLANTKINGGLIETNSILAQSIAIGDFTNYSQLNHATASHFGFTTTDDSGGEWFTVKNMARDIFLNDDFYDCKPGDTFRIEFSISTSMKGNSKAGGTDSNYAGSTIGLYSFSADLSQSSIYYAQRITASANATETAVSSIVTIGANRLKFRVFLQTESWGNWSGTLKIRNVTVRKMTAGNLIVDGAITADKIATDAIKSRNYISSGGTQGSFLNLSDGSFTSPNLSWDSNGNLIAKNANLSGQITATKGTVAGWTIISDKMYTTGSGKYTGIGKYGSAYAFWAGATSNDNGNSAVFKVGHTGKLTATDADITGTITATNGKIGRYDITETYLMTNSGSNASGIGGNQAFWAGAEDSNSAPFRVGYDGVLWAENAAIRGSIETGNLGDEGDTVSIINGHIGIQGTSNNVEIYSTGFKFGIDGDYYLESVSDGVKCYRNLYATDFIADGWIYNAPGGHYTWKDRADAYISCGNYNNTNNVYYYAGYHAFYVNRDSGNGMMYIETSGVSSRKGFRNSSDERIKQNFSHFDDNFIDTYMNLEPVQYQFKNDTNDKYHFGFKAQQTERILNAYGEESDKSYGICATHAINPEKAEKLYGVKDMHEEYTLAYDELIAPTTYMVQHIYKELQSTKDELTKVKQEKADLEVRLQAIEAKLGL